MIFGNTNVFAVEAVLAAEPAFGRNIVGSLRCYVAGTPIGNIDERHCVIGSLARELNDLAGKESGFWHPQLERLTASERFEALDTLFYNTSTEPMTAAQNALGNCNFLTNVSESFDSTKGFALQPAPGTIQLLVKENDVFSHVELPLSAFTKTAASFLKWTVEQELQHHVAGA